MKKYRFKPNYPRLTLPREHANATTKAYANPRDWSVQVGDDEVYHIVRLHREPELTEVRRLSISVRPPRRSDLHPQVI